MRAGEVHAVAPMRAASAMVQDQGWWPDWTLFGDAMLVGGVLATVLPCFGVLLVLRQQVFVAAAIGQAATFGFAAALACGLGHAHGGDAHGRGFVVGAGAAAAIATAIAALRAMSSRQSTLEARSAWVFLFGGSAAMVLLNDVPHGPQAVQRLFLSSLLTVAPHDVGLVAVGALLLVVVAVPLRRRLLLWAIDPWTAAAHGARLWRYDLMVGAVLGAWFGAAVLPVLAARSLAGSLRAVLMLAPLLGGLGLVVAFAVAHRCDLPPGQVFTAVQGAFALLCRLLPRR
jgi:ABC-type Mn2+/Zn2+ transport system permease subunit